jgi:glutaminyl-tRNA synthetase
VGVLLDVLAGNCTGGPALKHRGYLAKRIAAKDLKSEDQVQAAIKYVAKVDGPMDGAAFDEACGVGVEVSDAQVEAAVSRVVERERARLRAERYTYPVGTLLKEVREGPAMRWASSKTIKTKVDEAVLALLGPKTAEDEAAAGKKKKAAAPVKPVEEDGGGKRRVFEGEVLKFHKPGENPQIKPELMAAHLKATGGKVVTRFPPEPNGFLHIGHAKAMNLNFSYARANGGICYLRFDDTNPEAEEPRYYEAIRENVAWLGFSPHRETAASDNFQRLYEIAVEMIRKGHAYVCHMTPEAIQASRGGEEKGPRYDSPWRNRSVAENLAEFEKMRAGQYKEGEACLRLKQDMQSPNPRMWDLVAYRILYHPHCRTGRQWNIYPMYDFTHCLCDSIENITHSLCTTEFISAREAYYWVCDRAEVYKPVQWEYSRLAITNTVLSKRRLTKLVELGHVASWDDPRLYTLAALRRRGFTPAAINAFAEDLGITTANSIVDVRKLEAYVRDDLNKVAVRRMAVLEPLAVEITSMPAGQVEMISIPNDPRDPSKGDSQVPLSNLIYIEESDFKADPAEDPNYFRLTPSQPVGIYKVGLLTATRFDRDASGKVTKVYATLERDNLEGMKPRTWIHWIAEAPAHGSPLRAEVRLYSPLFKSANPDAAPGGYLADIAPNSLRVLPEAFVDTRLARVKPEEKFQFQRVGYFCADRDSTPEKPVFNLTVSLKEDPSKSA